MIKLNKKKLVILGLLFLLPSLALAKIGVGVNSGKIELNESLRAGLIHNLPSVVVVNTGDEPSDYEVTIQHKENQVELKPDEDWFTFSPQQFRLEPQKTQVVTVKLSLPMKGLRPGDYFAFLSARPTSNISNGGTTLGVAAAVKLYFTVAPSNVFTGIYYRILSLLRLWSPGSYIVLVVVVLAILLIILRRFISFKIDFSLRKKSGKK